MIKVKNININNSSKYGKKPFISGSVLYVYCGRPRKLANPFIIGVDGSREEVINKFHALPTTHTYIEELAQYIRANHFKEVVLGCSCKPKPCHTDGIVSELDKILNKRLF